MNSIAVNGRDINAMVPIRVLDSGGCRRGLLTILFGPESEQKRSSIKAVPEIKTGFEVIHLYLSHIGSRRREVME